MFSVIDLDQMEMLTELSFGTCDAPISDVITRKGDRLYIATTNKLVVLELPGHNVVKEIPLPGFNTCVVVDDDYISVANTQQFDIVGFRFNKPVILEQDLIDTCNDSSLFTFNRTSEAKISESCFLSTRVWKFTKLGDKLGISNKEGNFFLFDRESLHHTEPVEREGNFARPFVNNESYFLYDNGSQTMSVFSVDAPGHVLRRIVVNKMLKAPFFYKGKMFLIGKSSLYNELQLIDTNTGSIHAINVDEYPSVYIILGKYLLLSCDDPDEHLKKNLLVIDLDAFLEGAQPDSL